MLSSSLLQLLFTDICYAFQSPSYPPGSSHPPLLLFSASSQTVAVHRLPCSQVGIHSLYKGKISSLPLLFLLFSPLLVSLFLQTELAMSSLLIFLSVLTLFSLLSTIALCPLKGAAILVVSLLCPQLHFACSTLSHQSSATLS